MDFKKLPKIELHCHLDGSARPKTLIKLAIEEGIRLPSYELNSLKNMVIAPWECKSLSEYLERFDLPIVVMQSK